MAAKLCEAEGGFLAEGADAETDALLGDERFNSVAAYLDVGVILREGGQIFLFRKKDYFVERRRYRSGWLRGVLLISHCGSPGDSLLLTP